MATIRRRSIHDAYLEMLENSSGDRGSVDTERSIESLFPAKTFNQLNCVSKVLLPEGEARKVEPEHGIGLKGENNGIDEEMEEAMRELNEAAKSLFQKDPLTDGSPRWNMEAEYLRGYMTCWTIKKGARLVAAVAEAVSESKCKKRMPDVSLQWIGRQLWGLTIQIPRIVSGNSALEHIHLAKEMDKCMAKVWMEDKHMSNMLHGTVRQESINTFASAKSHESDESCNQNPGSMKLKDTLAVDEHYDDPFAHCVPDKTGWLLKKSGKNSWQKRWFELKRNRLYYFGSDEDGIPRGAIVLDRVKISACPHVDTDFTITSECGEPIRMLKFSDKLTHRSFTRKNYTLRAASSPSAFDWIEMTSRASIYCHFSLPLATDKSNTINLSRVQRYGTIRYLRETDPLLWEINPLDQSAIKKKAAMARTEADYIGIFTKYSHVLQRIQLPSPRPISIEQILRDIEPEAFLINGIPYGGRDQNIDCVFEVLESYVKRFTAAHDERVNIVSAIVQASARTIGGGDSYFVVEKLFGNHEIVIKPSQVRGIPIEITIDSTHAVSVIITSLLSFHDRNLVEQEAVFHVRVCHVQHFDFHLGKCSRSLQLKFDHTKVDSMTDFETYSC